MDKRRFKGRNILSGRCLKEEEKYYYFEGEKRSYAENRTITKNGTISVENNGEITEVKVSKIDKIAPEGNVSGSTAIGNTGTVSVTNIVEIGSGIKGYYVSTANITPTETSIEWIPLSGSSFSYPVTSNGIYYVWLIDNLGNISERKQCTVSGIVEQVSNAKLGDITVVARNTATPTLTHSGQAKTITYASSNIGIATTTGGTIKSAGSNSYAVVVRNKASATLISTTISGINAVINELEYGKLVIKSRSSNYGIEGLVNGKVLATTNTKAGQAQEEVKIYNTGYNYLNFASWTSANNQDDIIWAHSTSSNGNHSYVVKKSEHNNETGTYFVHIYSANSSFSSISLMANINLTF